jgi:hypothetical protein
MISSDETKTAKGNIIIHDIKNEEIRNESTEYMSTKSDKQFGKNDRWNNT